jgi:choline kinase
MTQTNIDSKVAIILAAGRGSRLKELSLEQPKPMVTVNNQTIISNLVSHLISAGIDHIVVTIGYKAHKLREHLLPFSSRVKLTFIENPIFDTTNNIYTLWLAKEFLKEGFYLFEADVFLEESILVDFLKAPQDDVMLVDKFTPVMNGTVVDFDSQKRVLGMYLKNNQTGGFSFDDKFKTVNFYKISKTFAQSFFIEKLDYHIQQNDTGSYYELIIKEAIDSGKTFYVFETGNRRWYEIDTREDLEAAESMFK